MLYKFIHKRTEECARIAHNTRKFIRICFAITWLKTHEPFDGNKPFYERLYTSCI